MNLVLWTGHYADEVRKPCLSGHEGGQRCRYTRQMGPE